MPHGIENWLRSQTVAPYLVSVRSEGRARLPRVYHQKQSASDCREGRREAAASSMGE